MAKTKAKSKTSGAAKLRANGKRAIMLTVEQEEYDVLKRAADADRRSLAGWITHNAVRCAVAVGAVEFAAEDISTKAKNNGKKGGA